MLYRPSRSGTPVATVAPAAILFILKEKVGSDKLASVRFANPSPFRRFLGMNLRSLLEGCDVNNLCFPRILVLTCFVWILARACAPEMVRASPSSGDRKRVVWGKRVSLSV